MKLPSYLRLTKHNIYVFRRRVPKELIAYFNTNEIRKSLQESKKSLAIIKARILALEYDKLFFCLQKGYPLSEKLSAELLTLVKHKKELLAKDEKYEQAVEEKWGLQSQILAERKANNERSEREINLVKSAAAASLEAIVKPKGREVRLSKIIELFFDESELKRRGDSQSTTRKDKDALNYFIDIIGNKLISEVNQVDAAEFARKISTNLSSRSKIRAASTVNTYLNCVSKFSGWVFAHHSDTHHVKLDFSKLRHKKKVKSSEARDAFIDDEVSKIFNHTEFTKLRVEDASVYWVIYIAAYSGARLEEIAQLDPLNDIYQIDSVWVFDINHSNDKQLKNLSSKRLIPIHSKLIEIGLLSYVECLKMEKATALLSSETRRDGRIGKNVGKRISYLIQKKIGISNKSLHCFRHTLVTKLKRLGVKEDKAAAIVGHESGKITYGSYGKDFLPYQLKEIIEQVVFN